MEQQPTMAYMQVVERGVVRFPATGEARCSATERAFIVQAPEEPTTALVTRVVRRTQEFVKNQIPLECAVIVASDAVGDEVLAGRYRIVQALVRAMAGVPKARLHFSPPRLLTRAACDSLLSMVGTVASQLQGLSVEVSVRLVASVAHPRPVGPTARGAEGSKSE
jgi:hypothetical protein